MVVGWGKMSSSTIRAPQMQFLEVPLTSWDTCLRTYASTGALDSSKSVGESFPRNSSKQENLKSFFLIIFRRTVDVCWRGGKGRLSRFWWGTSDTKREQHILTNWNHVIWIRQLWWNSNTKRLHINFTFSSVDNRKLTS